MKREEQATKSPKRILSDTEDFLKNKIEKTMKSAEKCSKLESIIFIELGSHRQIHAHVWILQA